MICDMFTFKQIHVLPRGLPRGYPLDCGQNHIQMEGRYSHLRTSLSVWK